MFTLPKEENWKYQGSGGMLKTNLFKGKYVNWNLQRGRGLTPPPKKKPPWGDYEYISWNNLQQIHVLKYFM